MNKTTNNYVEKLMGASFEDRMEAISMLSNSVEKDFEMFASRLGYKITKEEKGIEVRTVEKVIDNTDYNKIKELEDKLAEYEARDEQQRQEIERHLNRIFALQDTVDKLNYTIGELEKTMFCDNTTEEIVEYCGECDDMTKQIKCHGTNELQCTVCNSKWEDLREEQPKKGADKVVEKQPKAKEKVVRNNKLINCGPSVGDNEVLFIEKRRNNLHLWYGQIRIDNEIRNFHWSNELQKPVVYGVASLASLTIANELIREAVKSIDSKELTKYDMVPDHPDFGGFKARHYYGALEQGAYIYMTPAAQENGKEEDIVFKGYINKHAFVVWRNGEVRFRHYNYINMTKPFEKHASKGFNTEQMMKDIDTLANTVLEQFEKAASKTYRRNAVDNNATDQGAAQNTNDNKVENTIDGLSNADIGGLL